MYKFFFCFIFDFLEILFIILFCIHFSLPDIEVVTKEMFKTQHIEYYDDENNLIDKTGDELKTIDIELIPTSVIKALIAIEDKNFFQHQGIDYQSLFKNMYINLLNQTIIAGGSTISQQLSKNILQNQNFFGMNDRSILRKIKELMLTFKLEKKYSKNQILYFYLNRVYFGKNCYGIETASQFYFNKSASALSLYEAVLLIGLVQSPSKYSSDIIAWKNRAKMVLARMKVLDLITKEEEIEFENFEVPEKHINASNIKYFTNFIAQNIPQKYKNRDLKIKTTFNSQLYKIANVSLLYAQEQAGKEWNSNEAAFVMINKNGAIKVLIGGLNYAKSNFNIATTGKRPSGSVAKYFTYLTALEMGLNPKSLVDDSPYEFGDWQPSNYLHQSTGFVQVDVGFAQSINSVSIRIIEAIGANNVVKMIRRLGIQDSVSPTLALSLGGLNTSLLNLTTAFLPIINQGYMPKTYCIEEITDANTGEILYRHEEEHKKIIDERTAYYMWNMMKRTVSPYGTGKKIQVKTGSFGGKSGTSNENRDLYFILANIDYCLGCWFGRKDFTPMNYYYNNLTVIALNKFLEQLEEISDQEPIFDLNIDDINIKTLIELYL